MERVVKKTRVVENYFTKNLLLLVWRIMSCLITPTPSPELKGGIQFCNLLRWDELYGWIWFYFTNFTFLF